MIHEEEFRISSQFRKTVRDKTLDVANKEHRSFASMVAILVEEALVARLELKPRITRKEIKPKTK